MLLFPATCVQWAHEQVARWEGGDEAASCSHQNRYLPWIQFAFPAYNASAKTTMCGLTECLIHDHGIPDNAAADQGTHFTTNEVW